MNKKTLKLLLFVLSVALVVTILAACGSYCSHTWEDGVCTTCKTECKHSRWDEGVCTSCGTVCVHQFEGDTCTVCGLTVTCTHTWENGVCTSCNTVCTHTWENGVCTVCATACTHTWENGVCTVCATACTHTWEDGVCTTCALECEHNYEDKICTICGEQEPSDCAHRWLNNSEGTGRYCSKCGDVCVDHTWNERYTCTNCKFSCRHDYSHSENCSICNKPCEHKTWINGVCYYCAKQCEHDWVAEVAKCSICNLVCKHQDKATNEWLMDRDEACPICSHNCQHDWINGVCIQPLCKRACIHEWDNGECTNCKVACMHEHYTNGICNVCNFNSTVFTGGQSFTANDYWVADTNATATYFNMAWYVDFDLTNGDAVIKAPITGDFSNFKKIQIVLSGLKGITCKIVPFGKEELSKEVILDGVLTIDEDNNQFPEKYRKEIEVDLAGINALDIDWSIENYVYIYISSVAEVATGTTGDLIVSLLKFSSDDLVVFTEKQRAFEDWCDNQFIVELMGSTFTLHYKLRNPDVYGIAMPPTMYSAGLDDLTGEDISGLISLKQELVDNFGGDNYSLLTNEQQLLYDILVDYISNNMTTQGMGLYGSNFGYSGIQENMTTNLAEYKFYSEKDVIDYLDLCTQLKAFYEDCITFERARFAAGYILDDYSVAETIKNCKDFLLAQTTEITPKGNNYMIESFIERINLLTDLTNEEKANYIAQNKEVFLTYIVPAYQYIIDQLTEMFPNLPEKEEDYTLAKGLSSLDKETGGGQKYYEFYVQYRVGLDMTVPQIFDWLKADVADAYARLEQIRDNSPEAYHSFTSAVMLGTGGVIDYGSANPYKIMDQLKELIKNDYPELPPNRYFINPVQPSLAALTSAAAYYMIPQIDDYTTNYIYYNQRNLSSTDLFPTLAHEGYPGHLYQKVFFYNTNPHELRSIFSFLGYTEGWAKYTEARIFEYFQYDRYNEEITELLKLWDRLFYGAICVGDIGVNYYGWSLSQMTNYFNESDYVLDYNGSLWGMGDLYDMTNIYNIVISAPAQYLSYGAGLLKMEELLAHAKAELGDLFVLKDYYTEILTIGPAQFKFVDREVNEWIEQVKAANQ